MTFNNFKSCLGNNPIRYRSILTIPRDVSFGLEFEMEHVDFAEVSKLVYAQFGREWKVSEDRSLLRDCNAEISSPPLFNERDTWKLLKKLGKLLNRLNPTYESASFQVNFDSHLLPTSKDKNKFLKLFAVYEDIIYRFSRGEDECLRESLETYAYPIIYSIKNKNYFGDELYLYYSNQKRMGVNIKRITANLIEFRTPNATSNPILWQNYITFFYYLIMYSLSPKCDEKELDDYIERFNKSYLLEYYSNLHEERAFELSKKLFRKTDDQAYFLSQYIGKIQ